MALKSLAKEFCVVFWKDKALLTRSEGVYLPNLEVSILNDFIFFGLKFPVSFFFYEYGLI